MDNKKLEHTVENLFLILPLFKKKLIRHDFQKEETDLSPSNIHILFILEDTGTLPISELAKILYISKPNITPLIQKLVEKELVERITDPTDRRYINVSLTAKGKDFIDHYKVLMTADVKEKLSHFAEEELDRLSDALQVLKEMINKIE